MIDIGIDPDSSAHGVSLYDDGKLINIESMTLIEVYGWLEDLISSFNVNDIRVHIEDVRADKSVWHNKKGSRASYGMTCQRVGMCKQAQVELERVCEFFGIKITRHKISKIWKDQTGKKQFEKVTGWAKQSNEDTRSAAYFGWLGSRTKPVLS